MIIKNNELQEYGGLFDSLPDELLKLFEEKNEN